MSERTINEVVEDIAGWMFTDSHVTVDRPELSEVLQLDWDSSGRLPSTKECELMVTGDDEGHIPDELEELFPELSEFLNSYF